MLSKQRNWSWALFVLGWIGAALPLVGYSIHSFPRNPPPGLIPILSGMDLVEAERHFTFILLNDIEGALAAFSVASFLTLPIYFAARVLGANGMQRVRGWCVCSLILMAVVFLEILRFDIRFGLNWFVRAEGDAMTKMMIE